MGRLVAAAGAPTLKRLNLELGGKTPMIVFDDADLDSTVPLLAAGVTTFAGEVLHDRLEDPGVSAGSPRRSGPAWPPFSRTSGSATASIPTH